MRTLIHRTRMSDTVAAAVAMSLALLFAPAPPAQALSQYCGLTAKGVGNNYVVGRDNGHPADEPKNLDGWNGRPAARAANAVVFAVERAKTSLSFVLAIWDAGPFEDPAPKSVKLGITIANTVLDIAIESAKTAAFVVEQDNARVDACSNTLAGDLHDAIFVAMLEEELAYLDLDGSSTVNGSPPPPGTRVVPSAMFLLPQDGMPAWQRDASLYGDFPGHKDLKISYQDGVLNAEHIGVATTVRNQIAYLEASNISTGDTQVVSNPFGGTTTVYGAGDHWRQAMEKMRAGNLRGAYIGFARAYQTAVTQTPPPGAVSPSPSPSPVPLPVPVAVSLPVPIHVAVTVTVTEQHAAQPVGLAAKAMPHRTFFTTGSSEREVR